ncbi:MAG: DsrE family protein [Steroidobacter sp.]
MTTYVLIESRDPFGSDQVAANCQLAGDLAGRGHTAVLYLIENGVFAARRAAQQDHLQRAAAAGVQILADDFSLKERGMDIAELSDHVSASPLEAVLDHLVAGSRVMWH